MILVAGVLAILGSFLPWIQATAPLVGTISRTGLDGGGDGIISIVLGIVMALFAIAILARSGRRNVARVGALICAVALGALAYFDIADVNSRIAGLDVNVNGSIGAGLIVVALAAVLGVVVCSCPVAPRLWPARAPSRCHPAMSAGSATSRSVLHGKANASTARRATPRFRRFFVPPDGGNPSAVRLPQPR